MQRSYISRVLKRKCDLSLEQAARIAQFLEFDDDETEYFINLVELERAGDENLRSIIARRLTQTRNKFKDFAKRLKSNQIDDAFAQQYYSHWAWMAVHMCLAVPELNDAEVIATRLKLDRHLVDRIISNLIKYGLVTRDGDSWTFLNRDIHQPESSPLARLNHLNWRQMALEPASLDSPDAIHFSSAFAISRNDAIELQNQIRDTIIDWRRKISPSPSEDVFALCVDWFPVLR